MDELTKEFVAESQEGLERMELCLTELEKRPGDSELLAEIFRTVHTIKGTTSFLGFTRLQTLAHTGENLLGILRDGKIAVTSELISGLLGLLDGLRTIIHLIESTGTEGERSTDDDIELITRLEDLKAGGTWPSGREYVTSLTRILEPTAPPADRGTALSMQQRTLRVDIEVLNRMMNLVGELVLTRNQIVQSSPGAESFPDLARRLNKVTSDLRESVRQARMQPVGHLFGKFPRMVRDLARTCGKQVSIVFEGEDTRLDKSLLEAVRDPLTHAVRNSVDHGIETPEERVRAGKPAEGLVRLRAFHQSGSVVIEVIDDGAGISTERVLTKAMERGVIAPDRAASMTQREILQLILLAGFSTAKEVTSVSGRGVGLDVARVNMEKVGGGVDVESHAGVGTTVRLRLPLTLAIIPALVVRSGGQNFALPQSSLTELVYLAARDSGSAIERMGTAELYRLRENLLPLVWLDQVLVLEHTGNLTSRGHYIAVLEADGRRFGLVVDDIKAPEEIVVKPLSPVLREIGVFSGATVLANGMLALILDAGAIGARARVRQADDAAGMSVGSEQGQRAGTGQAPIALENSLVIYEMRDSDSTYGNCCRVALPLSAVERIERVPLSRIEYAGGRAVLQYNGDLLPLQDEESILQELRSDGVEEHARIMVTVVVCLRPTQQGIRRIGVVVRRVLDVSAGMPLSAETELFDAQLAMAKDRITTMHRAFPREQLSPAMGLLKEVA